ncbi:MAG: M1 family metallopeptidase [Planctomycetes bacterium]|nr:M1 family metallopeptidase [Planctomycetota bacterium]
MRAALFIAFFGALASQGEVAPKKIEIPPLPTKSARTQRYQWTAKLRDDAKQLAATGRVEFDNPSPGVVTDLEFHLYWNGWKNTQATYLREQTRGEGRRADRHVHGMDYAAIDVLSIKLVAAGAARDGEIPKLTSPVDLSQKIQFVAADDQNSEDETVMRVALPAPIVAGESVALEIEFEDVVPRVVARTGRKDDFVFFAHWYPQLGVYEKRADGSWGWNTHQFHANTEFFGEYANYDVTLVLPSRYESRVGATGKMVEGPVRVENTVRFRFLQNDVHNFAWTADPGYVVEKRKFIAADAERDPKYPSERERVAKATGLPSEELKLTDVDVTILLQPEHADQADRHFRAVSEGLKWYGLWYGRYPYETVTVVDPHFGSGAGGMEYPTLFTAGTHINPSPGAFTPEGVTIHEFGHQHFYGLIGSNEFEHAWMDEGFNTYSTARTLAKAYGDEIAETDIGSSRVAGRPLINFNIPATGAGKLLTLQAFAYPTLRESEGIPILPDDPAIRWWRELPFLNYIAQRVPPVDQQRSVYIQRGIKTDRMNRPSYAYVDGAAYGHNSYYKPAMLLHTLERLVGPEKWARVMRAYCARNRFRHPKPDDFFQTLVEFAGAEIDGAPLDRFIIQTFGGSDTLDYAVGFVNNSELKKPLGFFGRGADRKLVTDKDNTAAAAGHEEAKIYEVEFTIVRNGEIEWPVDVEWKREGENAQRERFDGIERWWRKRLPPGPKL